MCYTFISLTINLQIHKWAPPLNLRDFRKASCKIYKKAVVEEVSCFKLNHIIKTGFIKSV